MKALILIGLFLSAGSISAKTFRLRASCSKAWNKVFAYCIVANSKDTHLTCKGSITGRTRSGDLVSEYLKKTVLAPGEHRYLEVYSKSYNPFKSVRSNIRCKKTYNK